LNPIIHETKGQWRIVCFLSDKPGKVD